SQAPLSVQCTDRSSGSITSGDWNFGDGLLQSSTRNTSSTYNRGADDWVSLMVTGSGGSNSKSMAIHVTAPPPPPPTADFTANTKTGRAPWRVKFTDRSSGSITNREWNFGDGSSHRYTTKPTQHYNNDRDYTVT